MIYLKKSGKDIIGFLDYNQYNDKVEIDSFRSNFIPVSEEVRNIICNGPTYKLSEDIQYIVEDEVNMNNFSEFFYTPEVNILPDSPFKNQNDKISTEFLLEKIKELQQQLEELKK